MMEGFVSGISQQQVKLVAIGPSSGMKSFCRDLTAKGVELVESPMEPRGSSYLDVPESIAVVGMAGRFPGAETLEELWETIRLGKDLHKPVPADRFDISKYLDSSGTKKNSTKTPYGCFIEHLGHFDAGLFHISPREAKQMDPTQRLLLMAGYEALELAGYTNGRGGRVGTYFGQTTDDWREANGGQDIDVYYVPGGIRAFGPARLNYHFKWDGPSYSVDTACSSSLTSIELACNALLSGDCDTAVAGGGNVLTSPNMLIGLSKGGFLSPSGSCKTFDEEADGYCRGEAVGVVVLKRLPDAISDNDNILSVIRSISTNHSAEAASITQPHVPTQERLYHAVLEQACVDPQAIDYIEMHGTGTQTGDKMEMASVTNVFGINRTPTAPLHVGSVKANMGHSEAGAGITSVIKALLMMEKGVIPPHAGIKTRINSAFPHLGEMNIHIADSPRPFKSHFSNNGVRRILINNFNAAGGNTSLLLENYHPRAREGADPRAYHNVVISGRTKHSFRGNLDRMLNYLTEHTNLRVCDLSYSTTARRLHHKLRVAYSVASEDDLRKKFLDSLASPEDSHYVDNKPPVVFTFAGQGFKSQGISRQLFKTCSSFRDNIVELDGVCRKLGLPSFLDALLNANLDPENLPPAQTQLALISLEIAVANLWRAWGVTPDVVIGHSLGEYSALCVAGALSVMDTLLLVGKRAQLMEEMCTKDTHAMLAVSLSRESIQRYLSSDAFQSCEISCINTFNSTVVSGLIGEVSAMQTLLSSENIKATYLKVPYAFHSAQMDGILSEFGKLTETIPFANPKIPVVSTLLAKLVGESDTFDRQYLVQHARQAVNLVGALDAFQSSHFNEPSTVWVECGPGQGCLKMVHGTISTPPSRRIASLNCNEDCWKTLTTACAAIYNAGVDIQWSDVHKENEYKLQLLRLPTYAFDTKDYWITYEDRTNSKDEAAQPIQAPRTMLSKTCLQWVEEDAWNEDEVSVTFAADPKEEMLFAAIRGHLVNGVGLCPSSVYSDMAFTAAMYLFSRTKSSNATPPMELIDMEIFRPLIVNPDSEKLLVRVYCSMSHGGNSARISVASQQSTEKQDHATCQVIFGDSKQWAKEWAKNSYLIHSRMEQLKNPGNDTICRIPSKILYRLFSAIVEYDEKYHTLKEVFLDCDFNEACGALRFSSAKLHGQFTHNPYWIDGIIHFAGFVLNNSLGATKDCAYISHGWEGLRMARELLPDTEYTTYVRMQEWDSGVFAGDVYVFDGESAVAVCSGLKFKRMKLSLLRRLLPNPQASRQQIQDTSKVTPPRPEATRPVVNQNNSKEESRITFGKSPTASTPSFQRILEIIAQEISVSVSELTDEVDFESLGVDSILSISIIGNVQQAAGVQLPSTIFQSHGTVASLRAYVNTTSPQPLSSPSPPSSRVASNTNSNYAPTPATVDSSNEIDLADQIILAVAAEMGMDVAELGYKSRFEELGLDSLMAIAILAAIKDTTGNVLSTGLFDDYPTVGDIRARFGNPEIPLSKPGSENILQDYSHIVRLLQGETASNLPPAFLIAPGSGYPGSYINLPQFRPALPVYTLESPFLNTDPNRKWTMEFAASIYINEIRKIRPHGPYIIGGWSIGGMHGYEVARQLLEQGENVIGLIMIDSPCPNGMPGMPEPSVEAIELTGMYTPIKREGKPDAPMPLSLKQHTLGSLRAIQMYRPVPMKPHNRPKHVFKIWATQGEYDKFSAKVSEATEILSGYGGNVKNYLKDPNRPIVSTDWRVKPRDSFGPNGWDRLVGDMDCYVVEGDHETIMCIPAIYATGQRLQEAFEKILKSEGAFDA
ncbi:polyketide synthase [Arthroderma uncinatum]|uniref:polyketide synthase n=1 Tax=Arthroderma uncinatum TaxID=74035 RepID=UPI00144AD238|nr:polyketide synthase [Arthroderma uncinatum]KAF3481110.1 polyketide synthase [Arthroderma uncinatum]